MAGGDGEAIVDFHLGAFNTEVAIAYGYTTNATPRTPAVRLLTAHRAYNSFEEVEASRIHWGDERLQRLGMTAAQCVEIEFDRRESSLDVAFSALARMTRDRVSA